MFSVELGRKTSYFKSQCSGSHECTIDGGVCWEIDTCGKGVCLCDIGYAYHYGRKKCVKSKSTSDVVCTSGRSFRETNLIARVNIQMYVWMVRCNYSIRHYYIVHPVIKTTRTPVCVGCNVRVVVYEVGGGGK